MRLNKNKAYAMIEQMSSLLKRLFINRKIQIFVDDYDHKIKMANDHIFENYANSLIIDIVYNYYRTYFSNRSNFNLDRLTDSISKTLIIGQEFIGPKIPYIDSILKVTGDMEEYKKYDLIIFVNNYQSYHQRNELQHFLNENIRDEAIKDLLVVSIRSQSNYPGSHYKMFNEKYSQRYLSSVGSTKNTPHLELKSKSGDRFNIPHGPFPIIKDWINYGLK